jgi:hypothetical protein
MKTKEKQNRMKGIKGRYKKVKIYVANIKKDVPKKNLMLYRLLQKNAQLSTK